MSAYVKDKKSRNIFKSLKVLAVGFFNSYSRALHSKLTFKFTFLEMMIIRFFVYAFNDMQVSTVLNNT